MRVKFWMATAVACVLGAAPVMAQPIVIGVSTPQTGVAAVASEWEMWGVNLAVEELNPLVQRFELVTEEEIAGAVGVYAEAGIRAEGAAAAGLAVALREELPRPVVLIVTGRNIDEALWRRAVETPHSFGA